MKPLTFYWTRVVKIIKKILWVFLALSLLVGGFFLAAHFKIIDFPALVAKYELYRYPILDRYLSEPVINFEPVEITPEPPAPADQEPVRESPPQSETVTEPAPVQEFSPAGGEDHPIIQTGTPPMPDDRTNYQRRQAAKLARVYSSMRPTEAAAILNNLDDASVLAILGKMEEDQAAQILALLDAARAADLTRAMLQGTPEAKP